MKTLFLMLAMAVSTLSLTAQQRSYFKMFDPNTDGYGEVMKKSPQKSMIEWACETEVLRPDPEDAYEDSMTCLGEVIVYDDKGRIKERYEVATHAVYTYDNKDRVIRYMEEHRETKVPFDDISIQYDGKGKITSITNAVKDKDSRSITYSPKDEKLTISEKGYSDEVTFKNGRIISEVNKSDEGVEYYRGNYTYDSKGKTVRIVGTLNEDLLDYGFTETFVYDASGTLTTSIYKTYSPDDTTALVKYAESKYIYKNKNLERREVELLEYGFPGDPVTPIYTSIIHTYDKLNRKIKTEYFDVDYLLLSIQYLYR